MFKRGKKERTAFYLTPHRSFHVKGSWNQGMVWVGSVLKAHLIPPSQVAPNPTQAGLGYRGRKDGGNTVRRIIEQQVLHP